MLSKAKRGIDLQEASHGWAKQNSQFIMRAASQASEGLEKKRPVEFKPYYKTLLPEKGTHYCEWPAGKANAEVQM